MGSWLSLAVDLASARVLPEAHLYFFDRYSRLADWHRARGDVAKANRFDARAEEHHVGDSRGGPPYAAAMAMP